MRIFLYVLLIVVPVDSSLYGIRDQDDQNEYPYNVELPSILHKYEFDNDPDMARQKYYADDKDDIDYDTFEENENPRDFERGFPDWLYENNEDNSAGKNVCDTKACHKIAAEIRSNIDASIDPCEDFDKFACGGWRKQNPIPKANAEWTKFLKLWESEERILKNEIERQAKSPENSSGLLMYNWYTSCMNQHHAEKQTTAQFLRLIAKLGSCRLINHFWFPFGWSLVNNMVLLNRLSIHPFFLVQPGNDLVNSSQVFLQVTPSKLVLDSLSFYLQPGKYYNEVRRAYLKMMIKVMDKLSPFRMNPLHFAQEINNVYRLELLLAKAKLSSKFTTYQRMTLRQLQWEIPEFPWRTYILKLYYKIPQKKIITGDEIIAVSNKNILRKIAIILRLTSKSTLANYLIWNVASTFSTVVSPDYGSIYHVFLEAIYGNYKRKERWRECVASTSKALSMGVGKLFIEEKFDDHKIKKAAKIVEDIRQQMIKDFDKMAWMDTKTKKNAKEKADAMLKNIGYPKFILNETLVRMYYRGMSFEPKNFLLNILRRRIVVSYNTLCSREIKPDRARWSMAPQQINAYYSLNYNKIVILAGILQYPFWKKEYPMSMQYGGIGFIIGHEISHGFDNKGMHFDKYGNYHTWSSNSSFVEFNSRSRCLVDQYSHYKIFGKNINGKTTLGENIADNTGVKLAFKAYQNWLKNNGEDMTLPGLPFNSNQLFFLKGAQMWCANIRRKSTLNSIDTDVHTPKMFRIIGPFSNFNEFSNAFNCSSKSRMNPEKKCSVW